MRDYYPSIEKAIVLLITLFSFFRCTPPLYIPNTTNTPALLRQGDSELSLSTGTNGWDMQAASAITNNIGIMLNGSFANHTNDSSNNYNKHQFAEIGVGYFNLLNKEELFTPKMKYFFSVYAGSGIGSAEGLVEFSNIFNSNLVYKNSVKGEYNRWFFQPSIGMSNNAISLVFSLRTSRVNFSSLDNDLDADWQSSYPEDGVNHNIFYEPTATFRIGGKHVKFFSQMGVSLGQRDNSKTTFRQRPIIMIFGIQGSLNWK